jgi:hypothetical protein
MDICFALVVLGVIFTIIAVVGHVIWLLAAAVGKAMFSGSEDTSRPAKTESPDFTCVLCLQEFAATRRTCTRCGLNRFHFKAIELGELEITLRQLARFSKTGELPSEMTESVGTCIESRRHELSTQLKAELGWHEKREHAQVELLPVVMPATPKEAQVRSSPEKEQILAALPAPKPAVTPPPVLLPVQPQATIRPPVPQPRPEPRPVLPPPVPPAPRRSFGEMLAGFMEERNILWGELVGGLLIVGCSIALVISLRETLEKIPYFPFLIVGALAAALIGAGRYTLSHWKLESTSRGLLVIGTMLVPLSFTVLAWVASEQKGGMWEIPVQVAAVAFFVWLVRGAADILLLQPIGAAAPRPDWLASTAIMGMAASQLLVPHIGGNEASAGWVAFLGYLPTAFFVLTQAIAWQSVYRQERINGRQAGGLFLGTGLTSYALLVAFGFILYRTANVNQALEYLAVPLALAGLPLLIGGATASAKLAASNGETKLARGELSFHAASVIATMLALSGTIVMLGALVAAWPHPVRLTAIATVNAIVLAWIAHRFRLVPAYVPAQVCLCVAALTGYHSLAGHLNVTGPDLGRTLWNAWFAPASGVVLLFVTAFLALAAEWRARRGRHSDWVVLSIGSGVAALASLLLVARAGLESPVQAATVWSAVAAGGWLSNARWQKPRLTIASAIVALGAGFFTMHWYDPTLLIARQLVWALLATSIATVALSFVIDYLAARGNSSLSQALQLVFVQPLQSAALTASIVCALTLVPALGWDWLAGACGAMAAVGGVWLVLAWHQRQAILFGAFQSAVAVAVLLGVVLALQKQPWFENDLFAMVRDSRFLLAIGLGQSALALIFALARFALRKNARAWELVSPIRPAVEHLLVVGMVTLLFALTAAGAWRGIQQELTAIPRDAGLPVPQMPLEVCGTLGWSMLGVLFVTCCLALWQEPANRVLPGMAVLAWCAMMLAALGFVPEIAVASATRWALAIGFVLFSAFVWDRARIARLATAAGIRWDQPIVGAAQLFLIAATFMPVFLLTLAVADIGFTRMKPSGPLEPSIFHGMGTIANNIGPLILVCIGLTGHAVREQSAGYAFAAGQVALFAVVGGRALGIVAGGHQIGGIEAVELGQLSTGVMAVWLLGWLAARRGLGNGLAAEDSSIPGRLSIKLMLGIQEALLLATHLTWLAPALLLCAFPGMFAPAIEGETTIVETQAASMLGWSVCSFALLASAAYRLEMTRVLPSWFLGLAAALLAVLASCTAAIHFPDEDQRVLMLVAAGLSLAFMLTLVRWSVLKPWRWLATSADSSVELCLACATGALAVILAIARVLSLDDLLSSGIAVALVSSAMAAAAWYRQREGWLFAGGLLAMIAVSMFVDHAILNEASVDRLVLIVQANLATAALVCLLWLWWLERVPEHFKVGARGHPLLRFQLAAIAFGNCVLLLSGFVHLVPEATETDLGLILVVGRWPGWLALITGTAASVWFLHMLAPRSAVHGMAGAGMLFGVLASCTATQFDLGHDWLGQHVLTLSWLLFAAVLMAGSWQVEAIGRSLRSSAMPPWADLVPKRAVARWVFGIGAAVVAMAVAGAWSDPFRPGWPTAIVFITSAEFAALAIWTRRAEIVFISGLLFNVAGHLLWLSWAEDHFATVDHGEVFGLLVQRFVLIQVMSMALASLVWSVIHFSWTKSDPQQRIEENVPAFRHLAIWVALAALGLLSGALVLADVLHMNRPILDPAAWLAVTAVLAATCATLWDDPRNLWANPPLQIYFLGLTATALGLHALQLEPRWVLWNGAMALGPYVLLATVICLAVLRISHRSQPWPMAWFPVMQAVVGAVVLGLSAWICLTFDDLAHRLFGFLTAAYLPTSSLLMTRKWSRLVATPCDDTHDGTMRTDIRVPRAVTLVLAILACIWLHVAFISPDYVAPWLHRSVMAMAALTWMTALYGLVFPRLVAPDSDWGLLARRLARPCGFAACAVLLLILAQEFVLYIPELRRTPLNTAGVVVVSLALVALICGALMLALSPVRDPLHLSERGRTHYVYAAEILLALLLFHLRLNVPRVPPLGEFWVFAIVAVAFLGVGLSELCQRAGLHVLADPLQRTAMFLPVLPLAAFLLQPLQGLREGANAAFAGLQPWTYFLDHLPGDYRWHAAIWFLMGMLYLVVALTRRSSNLALTAAAIANFGIWVLLGNHDQLSLLLHPQLWLIPMGAIVLAAESIHRSRLPSAQSLALRYAGMLLIYVSSTADMFIAGLGNNVILPIVLAVLSVSGVLLGILLRVRAFLSLGVTFLFLVVFSQIWHAAVDRSQTWVWWASGIVLGAAILTLFALFEKRRNDVLKMIEEIKRWR